MRITKIILTIIYSLLIASCFSSCYFSRHKAQKMFNDVSGRKFDIVIVPGVPLENGKWSRTMKGRIYWSKFLYDHGIAKNIMYSGNAVYSPYYEGEVMALYAEALGIPKEHIFTETKAEHSTENIYYGYRKAKKLGFKTFALASDPFQSKTLKRFIRKKVDRTVAIIPMLTDTLKVIEPGMIDPQIDYQKAFAKDFISIRKRQSYLKRLKGTLGKNIDYSLYQ